MNRRTVSNASSPQPPASSLRQRRPGISLLEVLISMFVLLFGLMGVAAIFPAGNHYAAKGEQYERGAALADEAFANLKTYGLLDSAKWSYPLVPATSILSISKPLVINPANAGWNVTGQHGPGHVFVIDPFGSIGATDTNFPSIATADNSTMTPRPNPWAVQVRTLPIVTGNGWPIRRITFSDASGNNASAALVEQVFRLHDDVTNEQPTESDRPGVQRYIVDKATNSPFARSYSGSYSWFATVTPTQLANRDAMLPSNVRYGSDMYEVSVAVCYKRDASQGAVLSAELNQGGALRLFVPAPGTADDLDAALKDIKPGNWISLMGVTPTAQNAANQSSCMLKWYKLQSLDDETDQSTATPFRLATIEGFDWPAEVVPNTNPPQLIYPITAIRAIVIPSVIGVETQMLRMESSSLR
jgi:hypothetical protein